MLLQPLRHLLLRHSSHHARKLPQSRSLRPAQQWRSLLSMFLRYLPLRLRCSGAGDLSPSHSLVSHGHRVCVRILAAWL